MEKLADAVGDLSIAEGGGAVAAPPSPPATAAKAAEMAVQVSSTFSEALAAAFAGATLVALDAEGVDLSRHGEISIVQLATPRQCFLLDVLGKTAADPLVVWLGGLLGDPGVVKIIHDCRMDADALYHLLSIDLANVHDTSCWHDVLQGGVDKNLNDTLSANGLAPNEMRDGSVYRTNPRFWATRPLTPAMVEWASGDVASMFALHLRQTERAQEGQQQRRIESKTASFLSWKSAEVSFVTVRNPGRFIGKGGCNIRSLQRRTATVIYGAPSSMGGRSTFMVYHRDQSALCAVQQAARA